MDVARAIETDKDVPLQRGRRDFARARLGLSARLVTHAGTCSCTVVDLSCSGAKIKADELPRVGAMVVVEGMPVELFGTVQWARKGFFGLRVDNLLDYSEVVQLRFYADGERERRERETIEYASKWVAGRV